MSKISGKGQSSGSEEGKRKKDIESTRQYSNPTESDVKQMQSYLSKSSGEQSGSGLMRHYDDFQEAFNRGATREDLLGHTNDSPRERRAPDRDDTRPKDTSRTDDTNAQKKDKPEAPQTKEEKPKLEKDKVLQEAEKKAAEKKAAGKDLADESKISLQQGHLQQKQGVGILGQPVQASQALPQKGVKEMADLATKMIDKLMASTAQSKAGQQVRMRFGDANPNMKGIVLQMNLVKGEKGDQLSLQFLANSKEGLNYLAQNQETLNDQLKKELKNTTVNIDIREGNEEEGRQDRKSRGEYIPEEDTNP